MNTVRVQTDDFDVAVERDALVQGRADIGAIVTFTGCVRGDDGLAALTIEHYPGMTER
jgi:molybdopterin synthase catalytic subunit